MRIEIEKDFLEKNMAHFAAKGNEDLSGEDKDKYLIIDTDDDLFTNQDEGEIFEIDGATLNCSTSNTGLYVQTDHQPNPKQIAALIEVGDVDALPQVIEVIVKKMNRIKSLLETVNTL